MLVRNERDQSLAGSEDATDIGLLLQWCDDHHIWIDPRLGIRRTEDTGICVVAREDIGHHETLVRIPKVAVLSVRSSSCGAPASAVAINASSPVPGSQSNFRLGSADGGGSSTPPLDLSSALLYELLRGTESDWYGYLQSLPQATVPIAVLWSRLQGRDAQEATDWIKGTEVERRLVTQQRYDLSLIDQYYFSIAERHLKHRLPRIYHERITLKAFHYSYSLVSSRAFLVDSYHGLAMVPIADVFNHIEEHHVHLESDWHVCAVCGSLNECAHDHEGDGRSLGSYSSATAWSDSGSGEEEDTCDMVSNTQIEALSEVFNTYDENGIANADLMCQYGFVLEGNEADAVIWNLGEEEKEGDGDGEEGTDRRARHATWELHFGRGRVLGVDVDADMMDTKGYRRQKLGAEALVEDDSQGVGRRGAEGRSAAGTKQARKTEYGAAALEGILGRWTTANDEWQGSSLVDVPEDRRGGGVAALDGQRELRIAKMGANGDSALCVTADGRVSLALWTLVALECGLATTDDDGDQSAMPQSLDDLYKVIRGLAQVQLEVEEEALSDSIESSGNEGSEASDVGDDGDTARDGGSRSSGARENNQGPWLSPDDVAHVAPHGRKPISRSSSADGPSADAALTCPFPLLPATSLAPVAASAALVGNGSKHTASARIRGSHSASEQLLGAQRRSETDSDAPDHDDFAAVVLFSAAARNLFPSSAPANHHARGHQSQPLSSNKKRKREDEGLERQVGLSGWGGGAGVEEIARERGPRTPPPSILAEASSFVLDRRQCQRQQLITLARAVTALCRDRIAAMKAPADMLLEEFGALLDNIPPDRPLTQLAMSQALSERALLETCIQGWTRFETVLLRWE